MVHICVKSEYLQAFFQKFDFWVVRGVKWQKIVLNGKKFCLLHHMIVIYGANVLNDIARCFFNFKILIFRLVKRLKGQKMAQSDKNSCLLHFIFQEPCIIYLHLWYTCIYKRIIYPGIFFIFFLLIFGIIRGRGCGKRVKSGPK